jgi:hypothetical protein
MRKLIFILSVLAAWPAYADCQLEKQKFFMSGAVVKSEYDIMTDYRNKLADGTYTLPPLNEMKAFMLSHQAKAMEAERRMLSAAHYSLDNNCDPSQKFVDIIHMLEGRIADELKARDEINSGE